MCRQVDRGLLSGSAVSDSLTPGTVAHQAPLSMGFSWQEYWSGLPCPPPGDLPNPGIKSVSPVSPELQVNAFPVALSGKILQNIEGKSFDVMRVDNTAMT